MRLERLEEKLRRAPAARGRQDAEVRDEPVTVEVRRLGEAFVLLDPAGGEAGESAVDLDDEDGAARAPAARPRPPAGRRGRTASRV